MDQHTKKHLERIATLLRYWILDTTTTAGSGHPTSSLSAVEIMTVLFFGGILRYDVQHPREKHNDRVIFSKGHATPLFYALWAAAGAIRVEDLSTYRQFDSALEGHPTMTFPFTEAATGSLGQGLSVGLGMALAQKKLDKTTARTFVLLGDSEMAEGQVWEAMQIAAHYEVGNLTAIVDVNRLGQRGVTMDGHHMEAYARRARACGWRTVIIHGHNIEEISRVLTHMVHDDADAPLMIIAQTYKGKGISFLEDKYGWHGKTLSHDEFLQAVGELGYVDFDVRGTIAVPQNMMEERRTRKSTDQSSATQKWMHDPYAHYATRDSYGAALVRIMRDDPTVVVLDAEVSNSTMAEVAQLYAPERFFEMYIAEQNMVGVAVGLARCGYHPFISSFAAFLTRAHDQIRMAAYSDVRMTIVGSHAGVATGADGVSQMGLEDVAMMRSVYGATVLSPADARATVACVKKAHRTKGITYIRTAREKTPLLSHTTETHVDACAVVCDAARPQATIIATGTTVAQACDAAAALAREGIAARVVDVAVIAPLDVTALHAAMKGSTLVVIVEDHYRAGGLGEAVLAACAVVPRTYAIVHCAVDRMPRSGSAQELYAYEKIDAHAIIKVITQKIKK